AVLALLASEPAGRIVLTGDADVAQTAAAAVLGAAGGLPFANAARRRRIAHRALSRAVFALLAQPPASRRERTGRTEVPDATARAGDFAARADTFSRADVTRQTFARAVLARRPTDAALVAVDADEAGVLLAAALGARHRVARGGRRAARLR